MIGAGRATRYRGIGFDRVINADRPIRGALAAPDDAQSDILVRWHPPVCAPEPARIWSLTESGVDFAAPGVARYRCSPARIDVTPFADVPTDMVDALLLSTALPAMLWLAGDFVLHAAAVVPAGQDGAIAIAGPSGIGKSRLAAGLLAGGARFVADDSIAVRWRDGGALCAGLAGGYHHRDLGASERVFHVVPAQQAGRSAPLAVVVILGSDGRTGPLDGVGAVEALLANRHRPSVPRLCGLEARGLAAAARLARTVAVYTWSQTQADALLADDVRATIMGAGVVR